MITVVGLSWSDLLLVIDEFSEADKHCDGDCKNEVNSDVSKQWTVTQAVHDDVNIAPGIRKVAL